MSQTIDLELLAAPIPGSESGVGQDLRTAADGGAYFTLKDLRAEARSAEREAAAAPDSETPVLEAGIRKWAELSELAEEVIAAQTKDLEIAGWLCEAQTRLSGFQGLADSLELLRRLVAQYWAAGLYPVEDEDGLETRVAPIGGLLGQFGIAALVQPLKLLPLSDRDQDVALWTIEAANAPLQGSDDADARARAQTRRSERLEAIRQAIVRSSPAFLRNVHALVTRSVETIERLVESLGDLAGVERFGSQVTGSLATILSILEEHVGHLFVAEEVADGDPDVAVDEVPGEPGRVASSPGQISSRAQAYDAILKIADFFAASEPQSLVAKSLREVVRRATLPLEELLVELLPDPDQRTLFLLRAGVREDAPQQTENYY
jgi:type VI secretion system protein ImpA